MIRQVPASLASPLSSLASFTYPALETLPTVQSKIFQRAHCVSNFCEPVSSFSFNCITIDLSCLFLRQASSSCFTSSAGIFIAQISLLPPPETIHRPLPILSCRHEFLIYPSRSPVVESPLEFSVSIPRSESAFVLASLCRLNNPFFWTDR
jgi:hypothetical protein